MALAIDTHTNTVIANVPSGQAPQADIYMPDAFPPTDNSGNAAMNSAEGMVIIHAWRGAMSGPTETTLQGDSSDARSHEAVALAENVSNVSVVVRSATQCFPQGGQMHA